MILEHKYISTYTYRIMTLRIEIKRNLLIADILYSVHFHIMDTFPGNG